jgi:hypothetical protein
VILPIDAFMKTIILFLAVLSSVLSASPVWVQVSSIKSTADVPTSFLKTIEQSGFEHKIIDDAVHKKVCIGSFKNHKEALSALPKIRCKIAYDAFIVNEPSVTQPSPPKEEPVKETITTAIEPLPQLSVAAKPCLCIYDVHFLHKMEIDDMLAYYRTSPFYNFKK